MNRSGIGRTSHRLPADLATRLDAVLQDWQTHDKPRRLWDRDASLWSGSDEGRWLGWLGIVEDQRARSERFTGLSEEIRKGGFTHALLLGMGGSSLCPEVLASSFGRTAGSPELHVLDSTDPAQVRASEKRVDLARTLFIVSSKSGSTLEPNIFKEYFFERAREALGPKKAGDHFIAITDPGSKLEEIARADRFRRIFPGVPSIGGRYSALSDFGMVPAAVMGLDVPTLLDRTLEMVRACASQVPAADNPGVVLGGILGASALSGRDKITFIVSPRIGSLGAWIEQLLAESTGKDGKALIPVDGERPAPPDAYGEDRLFVYVRLIAGTDEGQDAAVARLEEAGRPVVRIEVDDPYDLGQEFFRWEIATAGAGSILGINAFDQPDVEASKVATRQLTSEFEETGTLPPEIPLAEEGSIRLFADTRNARELELATGGVRSVGAGLEAHLNRLSAGDYFALLAYVERHERNDEPLQAIRHAVRNSRSVASCLGYGPRFLHSTGQAYKGGPNSGVVLQVTCDDRDDRPVPGRKYSFGLVKAAQARGDLQVLAERGRRALRVHVGPDVTAGLERLEGMVAAALKH
jgi:glucose-6-phosphate isomerase